MGTKIEQIPCGSIALSQNLRQSLIDESTLNVDSPGTVRSPNQPTTPAQLLNYRSTLGKMLYIGRMSNPVMLYHASHMATKTNRLETHHLKDLKSLLKYDKQNSPTILFKTPSQSGKFTLEAISDASMSSASEGGGRGAYIIYRRTGEIVHPLFWNARKLRRVARSSSTAELLAASDAASNLVYLQELIAEISYRPLAEMLMDSRSLLNLSTSIKQPTEAANKLDLALLRESFHLQSICAYGWVPGHYNIADALTKDNRETSALLLKTLREGTYPRHPNTYMHTAEPSLEIPDDDDDQEIANDISQRGGM